MKRDRTLSHTSTAIRIAMFVGMLSITSACTLQRYQSTEGRGFRLASKDLKCRPVREHHRYYFLFGALPSPFFGKPDPVMFRGKATRRFTEKVTPIDIAITALGGWAITLTRRTVIMEVCGRSRGPSGTVWRESVLRSLMGGSKAEFALSGGKKLTGTVAYVDADTVTILTKTVESGGKPVDRVLRRDGRVIEGNIITQDGGVVAIRKKNGLRLIISKSKLKRIQYGVASRRTVTKKHKLDIDQVKRITLK